LLTSQPRHISTVDYLGELPWMDFPPAKEVVSTDQVAAVVQIRACNRVPGTAAGTFADLKLRSPVKTNSCASGAQIETTPAALKPLSLTKRARSGSMLSVLRHLTAIAS
jgi:hypothetical protein